MSDYEDSVYESTLAYKSILSSLQVELAIQSFLLTENNQRLPIAVEPSPSVL